MNENPLPPSPTGCLDTGSGPAPTLTARAISKADLDARTIDAWAALERCSADRNPFLSPKFMGPALRHLSPDIDARIVLVETGGPESRLVALGVFENVPASRHFPLPHQRAYRSQHSFLSGVLLDAAWGGVALDVLLAFLGDGERGRTAIHVGYLASDSLFCKALRTSPAWFEGDFTRRAILVPPDWGEAFLSQHLSAARRKDLRRRERHLAEIAPLKWRLLQGDQIDERCIDTFLRLEDSGWRNTNRSSLRAVPGHEDFFRAMVSGFAAEDRVFFAELVLGDRVIASSSNLLHGNAAFAFKLGWDASYASMSPGMLNEVELVRQLPKQLPGLDYLDSCAAPGSFLESLYAGRRELVSGHYALSIMSSGILRGQAWARSIKRQLMR